jgi:outer membrane protein OmpA-like peptidoglycan-associated protein
MSRESERSESGDHGSHSVQTSVTRVREWIRLPSPRWAFIPWGLLPILGMVGVMGYGLTAFAKGDIESEVHYRSERILRDSKMDWVNVAVSGQEVTLSGIEPTKGAGAKAIELVQNQVCGSWAGEKTCATEVTGNFTAGADPVMPDFLFVKQGKTLKLTGEVPNEATKTRVVARAKALIGQNGIVDVIDELKINNKPAPSGYDAIVDRGVDTVARCLDGKSNLTSSAFGLSCEVESATEKGLRGAASADVVGGRLGTIDLRVKAAEPTVDPCDKDFADALSKAQINFATSSAIIQASSDPLLDKLAEIAKRCPGKMRVEGHTDNRGQHDSNMSLSRARAESVRTALVKRGIQGDRLTPEGFGPDKPIGDNGSDEGRAKNRRIEVHMQP